MSCGIHDDLIAVANREIVILAANARECAVRPNMMEEMKRLDEKIKRINESKFVLFIDAKRRQGGFHP